MRRLTIFILLILLFVSCDRQNTVDDIYLWPVSGVAEADSLLVEFEREQASVGSFRRSGSSKERFCSVADRHPDHPVLQFRKSYMEAYALSSKNKNSAGIIAEAQSKIDSASYPYDWHMMNTLRIESEPDYVRKYFLIVDNIAYFKKVGALAEVAKNLNNMGNLMAEFKDWPRALDCYREAEEIYDSLHLVHDLIIVRLNIPLVMPLHTSDSMFCELRKDSLIRQEPLANVRLMQNSFIRTDSLAFVDEAIRVCRNEAELPYNYPMLLAFKGDYMVRHGSPVEGLAMIEAALDSVGERQYNVRYMLLMHYFKANAYDVLGIHEDAIREFDCAWAWRDSLDRMYNKPGVYAMDAKARIEMTERNGRLEQERIIILSVISLLGMAFVVGYLILWIRKKNAEKRYQEMLTEEKLQRNKQSILAQAKVMEESDRLVDEMCSKIFELRSCHKISDESADSLERILRLHKSNEDNRQGFLKVQQELDSRFMSRLKEDFPTLSEGQLRLASLIAAGVDNRQIGCILNIEQSSVHKSRYRLRSRLGLSSDQSLEDFLRNYNLSGRQ